MKLEAFILRLLQEVYAHDITPTEAFDKISKRLSEEFDDCEAQAASPPGES